MSLQINRTRSLMDKQGGPRAIAILFVCTGNICRSPMAEVVFRRYAREAGLAKFVTAASAGTHDYNMGQEPDDRARIVLARRGYEMHRIRARQISQEDFRKFDLLLAMDNHNLGVLERYCPRDCAYKIGLLTDYSANFSGQEIADPFGAGDYAFERALDLIESAAAGLVDQLRRELIAREARLGDC